MQHAILQNEVESEHRNVLRSVVRWRPAGRAEQFTWARPTDDSRDSDCLALAPGVSRAAGRFLLIVRSPSSSNSDPAPPFLRVRPLWNERPLRGRECRSHEFVVMPSKRPAQAASTRPRTSSRTLPFKLLTPNLRPRPALCEHEQQRRLVRLSSR